MGIEPGGHVQGKLERALVLAGLGIALLAIACSVVLNVIEPAGVESVVGIGLCPGASSLVLSAVGAVVALRRKYRGLALAGAAGVLLAIVGCSVAAVATIGSLRASVRDAKIGAAKSTLQNHYRGERAYFESEVFDRVAIGATATPRHRFVGGGRGTHASCCPIDACRRGRTFAGAPWEDLGVVGSEIPSPWTFEIEASGTGRAAVARLVASADLACDGNVTRVSLQLNVNDAMEVVRSDFVVEEGD